MTDTTATVIYNATGVISVSTEGPGWRTQRRHPYSTPASAVQVGWWWYHCCPLDIVPIRDASDLDECREAMEGDEAYGGRAFPTLAACWADATFDEDADRVRAARAELVRYGFATEDEAAALS